jgi:conjugal transfer ATP-binding protein TraC
VCLNLHFPDPEATRVQLTAQRQWAANMAYGPMVKFLPALAPRKHGFDVLFEALDNGDRPLKGYLGLVLFTPPSEAVAALSNLRTYWRELGFQVMADHFFSLPLFLHCLPFGAERAVLRDSMRYRTLVATQAVTLMPVFGDWKGTGTPVLNLDHGRTATEFRRFVDSRIRYGFSMAYRWFLAWHVALQEKCGRAGLPPRPLA